MLDKIKEMTKDMEYNKPATKEELEEIEKEFNIKLPENYKDFMLLTNGAEGPIGKYGYLAIFDTEEVKWYNAESPLKENFPELFFIASIRGGYVYAIDTRKESTKYVQVDDLATNYDEVKEICDKFEKLIEFEYLIDDSE